MPDRNPYEIRHDLLVDARQMLFRVWEKKCEAATHNANLGDNLVTVPEAPTFDEVLELAKKMNEFVTNG